jgi:hypothetical protein
MTANLTPVETRAQDVVFVTQCSFHTLQDRLPFAWPAPPDISPSPKKRYRSHYLYQGWEDLRAPAAWEHLSDFDLTLRIVDFDPLRPMLAQLLGWTSAQGQVPFDPVSIFLLIGWQITNGWNRTETLRNIRHPRYADCATHFGFEDGVFPTEGGLRYWLTTIGKNSTSDETVLVDEERQIEVAMQHLNRLLAQSVLLFVESGLLTAQAWNEALVCPDGMIHDAASRMRCAFTQETCYQSGDTPRACPAKAKGRDGCDCDTNICHPICRYATPRDPDARFVCGTPAPTNAEVIPTGRLTQSEPRRNTAKGGLAIAVSPSNWLTLPAGLASSCSMTFCLLLHMRKILLPPSCTSFPPSTLTSPSTPWLEMRPSVTTTSYASSIVTFRPAAPSTCAVTKRTKTNPFGLSGATTTKVVLFAPLAIPSLPTVSTQVASATSGSVDRPVATGAHPLCAWRMYPIPLMNVPILALTIHTAASSMSGKLSTTSRFAWCATFPLALNPGNVSITGLATPSRGATPVSRLGASSACLSMARLEGKLSSSKLMSGSI